MSDELGIAAHGLRTQTVSSTKEAVERVVEAAVKQRVGRIIVGLPLNMDGSSGPRVEATLRFCTKCRRALTVRGLDVPVETFDERLTTMRARAALHEMGLDERKQRAHVDRISAVVLLQDYLGAAAARGS